MIVDSSDKEIFFSSGERVNLICIAHGIPRPSVKWYKDDIQFEESIMETLVGEHVIRSMIEFENSAEIDSGRYHCEATYAGSSDRKYFEIIYSG